MATANKLARIAFAPMRGEDRIGEAELADRGGDLHHLAFGMGAGIAGIGDEIAGCDEAHLRQGEIFRS